MSMLTAQCAKLRKAAYEVERIKNGTIGMPTRDVLILADTAMQLRHAADTIAELRNRLTEQTCRLKKGVTVWLADYNGYVTEWTCDECGGITFYDAEMRPRFCADCGAEVVG